MERKKDESKNYSSDEDKNRDVPKFNTLMLGPGGIKGFCILGGVFLLNREKILKDVINYCGVSVGSIICLLLVIGYSVNEIISHALDTNIFPDLSCIDLSKINNGIGLISNEPIRKKLSLLVEEKYGHIPTLKGLYTLTGYNFYSVTLNLTSGKVEYLHWKTHPEMSCVTAVMLSMNIPIIFYQMIFDKNVYVDGAFGNPYPVDLLDDGKNEILGIGITSKYKTNKQLSTMEYFHRFIHSTMNSMRDLIISHSSSKCHHFLIEYDEIDMIGITVDIAKKADMLKKSYLQCEKFLRKFKRHQKEA